MSTRDLIVGFGERAGVLASAGRLPEALRLIEQAIALTPALTIAQPGDLLLAPGLSVARADTLITLGRAAEAIAPLREAVRDVHRAAMGVAPDDESLLADACSLLGRIADHADVARDDPLMRDAVTLAWNRARHLADLRPFDVRAVHVLLDATGAMATLVSRWSTTQAVVLMDEHLGLARWLATAAPGDATRVGRAAAFIAQRATSCAATGAADHAAAGFDEALALLRTVAGRPGIGERIAAIDLMRRLHGAAPTAVRRRRWRSRR